MVESDGRKRRAAIRELREAKLLTDFVEGVHVKSYGVPESVLDEVEAEKPDLIGALMSNEYIASEVEEGHRSAHRYGVPLSGIAFSSEHAAYVAKNLGEFRFGYAMDMECQWFEPGNPPAIHAVHRGTLVVSSDGYLDHVDRLIHERQVRDWMVRAASKGLTAVLDIPSHIADSVDSGTGRCPLGGRIGPYLTDDFDRWEEQFSDGVQELKDQIAKLQQRLEATNEVEKAIRKHGGWQKFRQDFEALVRQELLRQAEKENQ